MRKLIVLCLVFLTLSSTALTARADGVLISWSARDVPGLTEQAFKEAQQLTAEKILQNNLAVTSWPDAFLVMVASNVRKDDKQLLAGLVAQISDLTTVKLKNTSRLIIWERIASGEILFEGKGYQVDDDLFSIAGRANWILRNVTKKNFGFVTPKNTADDNAKLQKKWSSFLAGEQVEEFKNPYATTEKGLEEIRSMAALEGLIASLKSTEAKASLTKDCLARLYKTDKLPTEGPATMCSPDTMTHTYLKILTGVEEKHDHDWWKAWLETSRPKLVWNATTGKFNLSK